MPVFRMKPFDRLQMSAKVFELHAKRIGLVGGLQASLTLLKRMPLQYSELTASAIDFSDSR